MSTTLALRLPRQWLVAPGWLPAALLITMTAAAGPSLGGAARPLFIAGCAGVGFSAWRRSSAAHLQAALVLFAFAPFARRLVDVSAGFDGSAIMLVGPLLAILVSAPELLRLLDGGAQPGRSMLPAVTVAGCVIYATLLSMFQGDWMNAASGALKWIAPLVYAVALTLRAEAGLTQAAARTFLCILPIAGAYGIFQYVDPPAWDRYWMAYATITSAGLPEPFGVRVYSTMNAPASFATFMAAGLLLAGFLRPGWQALVMMLPAALGLLLSLYRTAWISLAAGVLFCLLFRSTPGQGRRSDRRHIGRHHHRWHAHAVCRDDHRPPADTRQRCAGRQRTGAVGGTRHPLEPARQRVAGVRLHGHGHGLGPGRWRSMA